jgi:hypothetical protein
MVYDLQPDEQDDVDRFLASSFEFRMLQRIAPRYSSSDPSHSAQEFVSSIKNATSFSLLLEITCNFMPNQNTEVPILVKIGLYLASYVNANASFMHYAIAFRNNINNYMINNGYEIPLQYRRLETNLRG